MKKVFLSFLVASMMLAGCGKDKSGSTTKNDLQNSLVGTSWTAKEVDPDFGGEQTCIISFTSANNAILSIESPWQRRSDDDDDSFLFKERSTSLDGCINYSYSKGKGMVSGNLVCNGLKQEVEVKGTQGGKKLYGLLTAVFDKSLTSANVTVKEGSTTTKYTYINKKVHLNGRELSAEEEGRLGLSEYLSMIEEGVQEIRTSAVVSLQILSVTETSMTVLDDGQQRVFTRVK